jgi:hypothetical protein
MLGSYQTTGESEKKTAKNLFFKPIFFDSIDFRLDYVIIMLV